MIPRGIIGGTVRNRCVVYNLQSHLPLTEYSVGWKYQKAMVEHLNYLRKNDGENAHDVMLIVQHPSIYTLGKGSTVNNIKFTEDDKKVHQVVRVERGGEVTWHGPGQLVVYPIVDLHRHKKDLHWYTTQLEETVINVLNEVGIVGERSDVNTGVWVKKNKICAVGVSASRWITYHGLALNVSCDLSYYSNIIPCGIADSTRSVCSIQSSLKPPLTITTDNVCSKLIKSFSDIFQLEISEVHEQHTSIKLLDDILSKYPEIQDSNINIIN